PDARAIVEVVDSSLEQLRAMLDALHTDCPPGLAVRTDPDLLRRMLANLVDNAIKFSPAGGQVEVRVRTQDASDAEVELTVQDSGPGIAPENHRLVFEDLVQLQASGSGATPAAGHGLGLGIVR
ncbi:sensor histidine kinase, partial [Variovorax sp. Varisp62]|uniref:sensor histidine kinase n=1 Tax=Variovorax sp. Varisp62 TaxID=3243049 RepID=UPI0039B64E55